MTVKKHDFLAPDTDFSGSGTMPVVGSRTSCCYRLIATGNFVYRLVFNRKTNPADFGWMAASPAFRIDPAIRFRVRKTK